MRKRSIYFIAPFLLSTIVFSCKKVIDVSLKTAKTQLVINGEINNHRGPYFVTISKSVDFTENNIFPPVSDALVVISGNGKTDTLSEIQPGTYSTHSIEGKPGESYSLYVSTEGKIFTATSVMPQPVRIDSITFMEGRNSDLYAVANLQDPVETANYYQFTELVNGNILANGRGNYLFDDRLSNGRYIRPVLYDDSSDIKIGVTLTVQMKCVEKPVYDYLNELLQINGNGFSSPTPANPTSNISGGALGYFSANTVTSKSTKIE